MSAAKNPIILVHGFWDKYTIFNKMATCLKSNGYSVFYDLNLEPNNGKFGIEPLAFQLRDFINSKIDNDSQVDIVAFSMGGIVARYYIQNLSKNSKIGKLITIASPHHGTHIAKIFNYKACIQMRPGSDFLSALNKDIQKLNSLKITSIWAKFDTTIVPNSSSRLPFGKEIILPFGIHPMLPFSNNVISEVKKALDD